MFRDVQRERGGVITRFWWDSAGRDGDRGGACVGMRQDRGSRAVDSAFTWLIPRGKVPGLGDRR